MKTLAAALTLALSACASTPPTTPQATPQPAPGSSAHEQAKAVFDQALAAYQAQDYARALPLFRQASAQGFFKADRYLGLAYLQGQGVAPDPQQAFAIFQKAAAKDITSQYWLGHCYENGIGTPQDMAQAVYWYRQSAQRGDHVSQPALDALQRLGLSAPPASSP